MKSIKTKFHPLDFLGAILLLIFSIPFIVVLINSSKNALEVKDTPLALPDNWFQIFDNIAEVFGRDNIYYLESFFSSVIITTVSLVAIGVFSAMAAWVLVRTKKNYSFIIFMIFLSGMVLPFQVVMLPLVRLLQTLKDITGIPFKDTYHGIILAYIGFGAPLSVFLFNLYQWILKKLQLLMVVQNLKYSLKLYYQFLNQYLLRY